MIHIYTDGSFNQDTQTCGWGYVIVDDDQRFAIKRGYGAWKKWSNSRNVTGECVAVIKALEAFDNIGLINQHIVIHHDYEGVAKWITGEWETKIDLTKWYLNRFMNEVDVSNLYYQFEKVKAHSGDRWNDEADLLAKGAVGL